MNAHEGIVLCGVLKWGKEEWLRFGMKALRHHERGKFTADGGRNFAIFCVRGRGGRQVREKKNFWLALWREILYYNEEAERLFC
jgi:hypothetical protein